MFLEIPQKRDVSYVLQHFLLHTMATMQSLRMKKTKNHKELHVAAASSHRLKAFFMTPNIIVTDKATIVEVVQAYHGVRHHTSSNAQDCSIKVLNVLLMTEKL